MAACMSGLTSPQIEHTGASRLDGKRGRMEHLCHEQQVQTSEIEYLIRNCEPNRKYSYPDSHYC